MRSGVERSFPVASAKPTIKIEILVSLDSSFRSQLKELGLEEKVAAVIAWIRIFDSQQMVVVV